MWNRCVKMVYKQLFEFDRRLITLTRHLSSGLSYIHNPGSEPLRYENFGDAILRTVDRWPERVAVKSIHQEKSLTYAELMLQADALGYALRQLGLNHGDRLGVWAHNCAEWIVLLVATARVGIIPVAINPIYEKRELSFCIKKVSLKGLVIGKTIQNRKYAKTLNEMIPELHNSKPGHLISKAFPDLKIIITCGPEKLSGAYLFDDLVKDFSKHSLNGVSKYNKEVRPDDGCIIHFTSGTTGDPKAALDSHFGVVNNTHYIGKRNTLHERQHKICVQVPIFHAFGTVITLYSALQHGAALVLPSATFDSNDNLLAICNERCTAVYGTPTMFVDLISQVRSQGQAPFDVEVVLTAGAPCSPQLFKDIKQYVKPKSVKSLFGMTETTAAIFQSLPNETMEQVTETVGYIHDHLEVKVVDDQNNLVPLGTPGELLVRGYNTMMCYWDEPEKTRNTKGPDGWLRTGDKLVLQENGYGKIFGRLKDIIIKGGENIVPKEIEDILDTHPDIVESQIIGVPDSRLGEEICAVIRLREGSQFLINDLNKHCSGQLAKFKIPRLLRIVQEYPKTASGKIQKYKLREMVESGLI